MKRLLSYVACTIALGIGSISTTALAQTTAPGPYYATPSWDQTLPSSTRFIVLSNMNSEAVLDRETGLVWERSPDAASGDFNLLSEECIRRKTGGRYGWRLPTIQEFASLLDTAATGLPPLPVGHPFLGVPSSAFYWTATSLDSDPSFARLVVWLGIPSPPGFDVNFGQKRQKSGGSGRAWCVRGGLQDAPQ